MLSAKALDILSVCVADSVANTVTIPSTVGTLDRPLYEEIDEVLSRLGGKWVKKLKAHQFPYDPASLLEAVTDSGEMPPKNPTAFFPTPHDVVLRMLEAVNIYDGARVLEPSAGTGAIAKAIKARCPKATIDCCEVLDVNRRALTKSGFKLVGSDCLSYSPKKPLYDFVVMNPPFSLEGDKTAYITHFEHCYSLLKPRGSIACITPCGWLYGSTKKLTEFREFVCDRFDFEEIGSGAFKDSGTMVNTLLVYGEKDDAWRREPFNGWQSRHAWQASLWLDNDYELYKRLRAAHTRSIFDDVCKEAERQLVSKELVPIVLRQSELDELWQYYQDDEQG